MNRITPALAMLVVGLMAFECVAQPPEGKRGKRGPDAAEGRRPDGERRAADQRPDPAQMVARMMKEFDRDGDQKLDAAELTALMTSLRERRGGQRPGGAGQGGERPPRRGPGAEGKRRGRGEPGERAGGDKPARPKSE